jgi:hypothetical protein
VKRNTLPSPAPELSTHIVPAHQLGQPLGDRQAEARAAVAARGRRVDLGERPEQPVRSSGGMPMPGVAHREPQPSPPSALDVEARSRPLGELERVVEQVQQDLPQAA